MQPGDLVLANYTATVKDTGNLIETTIEDEAKKLDAHDPTKRYEPKLIAVGDGWVLKGVDEALATANVGEKTSIEVNPEKGFGERDPSKVRMMPIRRFGDKADQLSTGDEVEVEGRVGIIRYVGSGRAQVDFNHKYAGKTLIYDIAITKNLEIIDEKVKALAKRRIPIDDDKIGLDIEDNVAKLQLPEDYYVVEGIQIIKKAISNDVFKYIKSISKVLFVEEYSSPKAPDDAKKTTGKGAKKTTGKGDIKEETEEGLQADDAKKTQKPDEKTEDPKQDSDTLDSEESKP